MAVDFSMETHRLGMKPWHVQIEEPTLDVMIQYNVVVATLYAPDPFRML